MMPEMTSRQRVQAVLQGRDPDRVPFNFWMDRDRMAEYDRVLGGDFRVSHFGADIVEVFPSLPYFQGMEVHSVSDERTVWVTEPTLDDMTKARGIPMPDPEMPGIEAYLGDCRRRYPDKALFALILTPFELFLGLRNMEHALMDLYDHPGDVHDLLARITKVHTRLVERVSACDVDVVYLAGDICSSKGAILSPGQLEEFCFSYMRPLVETAHKGGKPVFYHTDGRVLEILGFLTDMGVDGINPVQPHLNDMHEFAEKYGERLMVYGALDNCYIIPDSDAEGVAAHVRETFGALKGCRGLFMSTHDIPGTTPLENVEAMVDTIKACVYGD